MYIELAANHSIDTQKAYRAVLKRYNKADKIRKRVDQVHMHLDNEHPVSISMDTKPVV